MTKRILLLALVGIFFICCSTASKTQVNSESKYELVIVTGEDQFRLNKCDLRLLINKGLTERKSKKAFKFFYSELYTSDSVGLTPSELRPIFDGLAAYKLTGYRLDSVIINLSTTNIANASAIWRKEQ